MKFQFVKTVDVEPLAAQIEAHPELWNTQGYRKTMEPHAQMSDIWVRYNQIERLGPAFNDEHVPMWYPAWKELPALRDIIFRLMADVDGEMLGGVLITRIPAGCEIRPHIDRGWHVDYYDKFYVQLKSEPGADFCCGDEVLNPKPGEVWRFDNRDLHWVINNSPGDRMTLIVCIRTDKYQEH